MTGAMGILLGTPGGTPPANLLDPANPALRALEKVFQTGPGSPAVLVLLVAVAAMTATAYYVWRWQQGKLGRPSSSALMNLIADRLGLSRSHRQLLWLLGRTADLEPAMALISPQLLVGLVHRAEKAGLSISPGQTRQISQILDAVSAACSEDAAA